jgi:nucleoid-associated protein YgaU
VSSEQSNSSFERWALLGAAALAAVGFAAFYSRHDSPGTDSGDDALSRDADILRVRIGGERSERPSATPEASADPEEPQPEVSSDPPPGEAAPPPPAERTVTVRAGETLGEIVQREPGTVSRLDEVVRLNGIENPDDVREGTTLRLPAE